MKKKKITLEKINEQIKNRNSEFEKMSPAQKRVAIAEDVIASIKLKKYKPSAGIYCSIDLREVENEPVYKRGEKIELQNILLGDKLESCKVCAIGGIFASKVSIGNSFKISGVDCEGDTILDLNDDNKLIKSLDGIFTKEDLRYIEYAFEGGDIVDKFTKKPAEFHEKINRFYNKYGLDSSKRLVAIMKNIIKNEGTFKL